MRKPIRSAGIVIKDNKILLIHRINKLEYYVFPGGGVEDDETNEDAVVREFFEETSVEIKVQRVLYHHHLTSDDGEMDQYFFLCEYISGEPKLGQGNELKETSEKTDFYEPLWFPVGKLSETLVFPLEIRDWLLEDMKNNFENVLREATLKISELRQSL